MQVAGEGAALILLDLHQARGQRRAGGIGARELLGEIVDGAGDVIELGRAEARQAPGVVAPLKFPQALDDRARGQQRVSDHERGENGDAGRERGGDGGNDGDAAPGLPQGCVGVGDGDEAARIPVADDKARVTG